MHRKNNDNRGDKIALFLKNNCKVLYYWDETHVRPAKIVCIKLF